MIRMPLKFLTAGAVTRRTLLAFTVVSAIINGLVTASVGAVLAQSYATAQQRRAAIKSLTELMYERRIKLGLVVSTLRRSGDLDELRYRKRSYDDTFVDWNKAIRGNLFSIREVMGEKSFSEIEIDFEKVVVALFADMDRCMTRAYDLRLTNGDPLPPLEQCKMADLYQIALHCSASVTNELFRVTRLSIGPFRRTSQADRNLARARINQNCTTVPLP